MKIPEPNNFAQHKPCVVLMLSEDLKEAEQVLSDENNEPKVFSKFAKARKHVTQFIDPSLHHRITFSNHKPVAGAGDREDTNNKRCLKCKGFLRATTGESFNAGGKDFEVDAFVCPHCDA